MKRRLKSYLVFTALLYRIMMYVLMPLAMVGIYYFMSKILSGEAAMIAVVGFLTMLEIVSDNWMFGGIQAKDAENLDFLRTSGRGMKVMQNALAVDLLRKFVSTAGIFLACCLVSGGIAFSVWIVFYLVLISYFFSVLGVLITRFFTMFWCNVLTSYVAVILEVICCVLLDSPEAVLWYDLLFAVLSVGVSILAVKIAMKKVKGQYAG